MKLLIVGGVAGGASAAARARRLSEDAHIVLFERGPDVSFANCGLPYFLGGEITDRDKLLVVTPERLRTRYNLDVRVRTSVEAIDRSAKKVRARDLVTGQEYEESYDKLILAPGAAPIRPPLPGLDLPGIFTLRNLQDMDRIQAQLDQGVRQAVVVGAGFIGLELVENLVRRGITTTVVELQDQVLPPFDKEMTTPIAQELAGQGVSLLLGQSAEAFEPGPDGLVVRLKSGQRLPAQLVVLGVGVRPENKLAVAAGLEVGPRGGIRVNDHLQTSDPDIYAVGVVGFDGVVGQGVQGEFLVQVLEEVLLPPALEHSPSHLDGRQVAPGGDDRGLVLAVVREARDLPQPELAAEEQDALVGQPVGHLAAVEHCRVILEARAGHVAEAPLAVGQDVEAVVDHLLEQFGAPAAAVEDDGDAAFADQLADLRQDGRQHLHQAGVGLGGEDEERLARDVIDPIVGGGRHRDAHARDVSLRQRMLAVVHAHVTVHVEEAERGASCGDAALGERAAELGGATEGRQAGELPAQGLDLGRSVQAKNAAQIIGGVFLDVLGTLDAPQRHEQQRNDAGAQAVEGRADAAVHVAGAREDAAGDQCGDRQQHAGARHARAGPEQGCRVVQQAKIGEEPVDLAVGRIRVRRRGQRLVVLQESGQVWVPPWNLRCGGRRRGGGSGREALIRAVWRRHAGGRR